MCCSMVITAIRSASRNIPFEQMMHQPGRKREDASCGLSVINPGEITFHVGREWTGVADEIIVLEARERQRQQDVRSFAEFYRSYETRAELAKAADVSTDTIRKGEVVFREADETMKAAVRSGERSIHSVYQALRPPQTSSLPVGPWRRIDRPPPFIHPSARIGPDVSVDQQPQRRQSPCAASTRDRRDIATAIRGPERISGGPWHALRICLTLNGELYAAFRTTEDLHTWTSSAVVEPETREAYSINVDISLLDCKPCSRHYKLPSPTKNHRR